VTAYKMAVVSDMLTVAKFQFYFSLYMTANILPQVHNCEE